MHIERLAVERENESLFRSFMSTAGIRRSHTVFQYRGSGDCVVSKTGNDAVCGRPSKRGVEFSDNYVFGGNRLHCIDFCRHRHFPIHRVGDLLADHDGPCG